MLRPERVLGAGAATPVTMRRKKGVAFLAGDLLCAAGGAAHGFSTRAGGVSKAPLSGMNLGTTRGDEPGAVRENYRRFCAAIGADAGSVVMANQVHGRNVRAVTAADRKRDLYDPEGYEADGLVTDLPGLALVVFSADCIPILLYDPNRRVAAAVHAGWRGTAAGIAARAAEMMIGQYGCAGADILCAIGPGISQCCFETGADVPAAMAAAMKDGARPHISPLPGGKFRVDLKALNALQLQEAGLLPRHISRSDACTVCNPELYWSHRVHGAARGSNAAMIQLLS